MICAQAFVHLDLGDLEKIKYSCDQAEALLELTTKLSDHREDLLRILVKLNTALNRDKSKDYLDQAGVYLRLLRAHSLSIKHQQFFLNAGNDLKNMQLAHKVALENPSYIVPSWITNFDETSSSNFEVRRSSQPRKVLPFDVQELRKERAETSFRTAAYNVAENWAVAAEYANGGTGQHCFHVGRVAGAIAKTLNFSAEEITRLDLACRLHDIGRVAVAFSKLGISDRRVLGTFSVACEHTLDGARLLLSCTDKTLELAANIARTHHEWWNGCGYPQGLRQDQIPIEGRICAVADFFVCLVCSDIAEPRWTTEGALMQIQTMAGMQLDPKLVRQLVQAFEEDETSFFDFCADKTRLDSNELVHSKKALCRSLDLVD